MNCGCARVVVENKVATFYWLTVYRMWQYFRGGVIKRVRDVSTKLGRLNYSQRHACVVSANTKQAATDSDGHRTSQSARTVVKATRLVNGKPDILDP